MEAEQSQEKSPLKNYGAAFVQVSRLLLQQQSTLQQSRDIHALMQTTCWLWVAFLNILHEYLRTDGWMNSTKASG